MISPKQKILYFLSFIICTLTILCPLWISHSDKALGAPAPTSDTTQVILMVANCNNNTICEPQFGENYLGCSADCPPPAPPPSPHATTTNPGPFGSYTFLAKVIPTTDSAYISWDSKVPTRGTLLWGITSDLELGAIAEINFGTDHGIQLNNLHPGTRYFFRIESVGSTGIRYYSHGEFFTLPSPDSIPPSNVSNIHIELKNDAVGNFISAIWMNPTDQDFLNVRVVRSAGFYSDRPADGKIIFEGSENFFEDRDLRNDVDYFYTFFSRDADGNYSSGVVVHFKLISIFKNGYVDTKINFNGVATSSSALSSTTPQTKYFDLADFEMMQWKENLKELQHLILDEDNITAETGSPILILLRQEKLIDGTASVLFSVQDENDNSRFNSYLVRSLGNPDQLETNIPAFKKEGDYSFFVTFLDKERKVISQTHGSFHIKNMVENSSFSLWDLIKMWISQIIQWIKAFLAHIIG